MFLLVLLFDFILVNILTLIGVTLAWAAYVATTASPHFPMHMGEFAVIYFFTVSAGAVFNYKTALIQREKQQAMLTITSNLAHELRTPLLSIKSGARGLETVLPTLLEGYQLALDNQLLTPTLRANQLTQVVPTLTRIIDETDFSNTIIAMLIMNNAPGKMPSALGEASSIRDCISNALGRYPYPRSRDNRLVEWERVEDFCFQGSSLIIQHVLFNLLKNSFYYLAEASHPQITLWTSQTKNHNCLHFQDNGRGITPEQLPLIFNRFYTTSPVGTGIGLAFCKHVMGQLKGRITCDSTPNVATEFCLYFPR